jgi:hypothetical protein
MNYFDFDIFNSKNTLYTLNERQLFIFTLAEYVAHNLCCQIWAYDNSSTCTFTTGKSVTCTGACANEIDTNGQSMLKLIAHSGFHVLFLNYIMLTFPCDGTSARRMSYSQQASIVWSGHHAQVHVLMRLYPIDKSFVCSQSKRRMSC